MAEPLLLPQVWLLRLALLSLPILMALSWPALREALADEPRRARWGLVLVVLGGGLARAALSLWSVDHENAIGWIVFEDAVRLDHFPSYGLGGHVLYNAWLNLFGLAPDTVFAGNLVLATLSPALLYALARLLTGSWRAGLLAAAALAFNPVHIRVSATESLHIPAVFLALLAFSALYLAFAGRRVWAPALLAALALSLAVQTRPEMALLVLPALLSVLLGRHAVPGRALLAGLGLLAATGVVHALWLWERVNDAPAMSFFSVDPAVIVPRLLVPAQHALADPAVTPLALQLLAGLGLVALLATRLRAALVLLALLLPAIYVNTTHGQSPTEQLRFHLGVLPWLCLLVGGAVLLVERWRVARELGLALGLLALVAALPLHANVLAPRLDQQRELDFWRESLPALPAAATLVVLDRFAAGGALTTQLPLSWFRAEGRVRSFLPASRLLAEGLPGAAPLLWYRGVTCWYFESTEAATGAALRPACAAVEERFALRPVAEARLPAHPDRFRVRAAELAIGFYALDAKEALRP